MTENETNTSLEPASEFASTKRCDLRTRLQQKTRDELDAISTSDYLDIGPYRYCLPYRYNFSMKLKPRWIDKRLIDVFEKEFRHVSEHYWKEEIEEGRVFANGKRACMNTVWKSFMTVEHVVHRHESRISSDDIILIHAGRNLVAVSKPSSLPVHPCGTYRRNCLQFRVAALYPELRHLYVVHRLDKETSGVVVFARSRSAAAEFNAQMQAKMLTKRYVAELHGILESEEAFDIDHRLFWSSEHFRAHICKDKGKEARTTARVLERRTHSTLVEAWPHTGRTHQLRAHFAKIGHPIVGDVVYGADRLDTRDVSDTALLRDAGDRGAEALREGKALNCRTCPRLGNERVDRSVGMTIHLHAACYSCGDEWSFEAPLPLWARKGADMVGYPEG